MGKGAGESWFRSLWGPRKHDDGPKKAAVGVLAFEIASLMSKIVHLWQSLSDSNVRKLREEITDSIGIRKLVSEDEVVIERLIRSEVIDNIGQVAKSVARLGEKCVDPGLKSFESFFEFLMGTGFDPCGWKFTWKKMDRKVKKMERYISINANLYQEMEILAELEQTLRRMKSNDSDPANMREYQKKVVWKQHEVKTLQEISLWNRSHDYVVQLLARSIFTVFGRVKDVFGIQQMADFGGIKDSKVLNSDHVSHKQSVSSILTSSVYPSEKSHARFASGPLGRPTEKTGPFVKANKAMNFHSGPIGSVTAKASSNQEANNGINNSGPLGKTTKSGPMFAGYSAPFEKSRKSGPLFREKIFKGLWQNRGGLRGKKGNPKGNQPTSFGPMKQCTMVAECAPVNDCYEDKDGVNSTVVDRNTYHKFNVKEFDGAMSSFSSKRKLLNALPETLGASGLALHYANVIIVIEKLATSPHLIGLDARDDLYSMLPASVRQALRARLKPYSKNLTSSVYCPSLASEWSEAITSMLEWLAPLAHSMIRWQSERSFEQQNLISRANILLVQTLYFANEEKTEAIITELLVGLNYIWRFGREVNAKALMESTSSRVFNEYLELQG